MWDNIILFFHLITSHQVFPHFANVICWGINLFANFVVCLQNNFSNFSYASRLMNQGYKFKVSIYHVKNRFIFFVFYLALASSPCLSLFLLAYHILAANLTFACIIDTRADFRLKPPLCWKCHLCERECCFMCSKTNVYYHNIII